VSTDGQLMLPGASKAVRCTSVTEAVAVVQLAFAQDPVAPLSREANTEVSPGSFLPQSKAPFVTDLQSDEAQVLVAFCGMGQVFLRGNTDPSRVAALGEVVCDAMACADCEVREGFERMGATAYFRRTTSEKGWEITAIDSCHEGRLVRPEEDGATWTHAKWAWRCSVGLLLTAAHHLVHTHWIVANGVSASLREHLPPWHPVRRVLHINGYNTAAINMNSMHTLFVENGILHRLSPFTAAGLTRAFDTCSRAFEWRTPITMARAANLPADIEASLPIFVDGTAVWDAMYEFYSAYVELYYADDDAVLTDEGLQRYWRFECAPQYRRGLPALSKQALAQQMTHYVWTVTCWHEAVGQVVAYTAHPAGSALQVACCCAFLAGCRMVCRDWFESKCGELRRCVTCSGTARQGHGGPSASDWHEYTGCCDRETHVRCHPAPAASPREALHTRCQHNMFTL
jgi:hypothetical protein